MNEYNASGGYQPEKSATEGVPPQERLHPAASLLPDTSFDCELAHAAIALIKAGLEHEHYAEGTAGKAISNQMILAGAGMLQRLTHYMEDGEKLIKEVKADREGA